MSSKLEQAFELFDAYNQNDPNIFKWEGKSYPQEYFLAMRLHDWVLKLKPNASEALLLASRCQHLGRWEIAREKYADSRVGYLQWRKDLSKLHAYKSTKIMQKVGYGPERIAQVQQIILKKGLKEHEDVQTIENALCLVFLQFQYEDFHTKHEPGKIVNILKKSLLKMDSQGHEQALQLNYSETGHAYIKEALKLLSHK